MVPVPSLAHLAGLLGDLSHAGTQAWLLPGVRALGRERQELNCSSSTAGGHGQGHTGTPEHITGKSSFPSRSWLLCPWGIRAGAAKPFPRLSSSLQPLPGKGGLGPELGLVCRSLALNPSSSSFLLPLLARSVELDLPAKESPCSPSRADMISEGFGSQGFYFLFFPFSRSRASKTAGPQHAAAGDQGAAGAAQAAPGPAGKAAGSDRGAAQGDPPAAAGGGGRGEAKAR